MKLILTRHTWALLPAVLLWLVSGCATNPVTGEQNLVLVSEAQELALGRQAHQQTLQQYRIYNDPALQQYVDAVGQQLAANSHRTDLQYTFTLLDSPEINAFALPGGFIYITRGLLAYMNSEAELAAVLGHELGHVTARHGVRQASSAQATSIGAGVLSIFLPQLRTAGLNQTLGMLSTAILRGYGREHELEADRLGADYIGATGYDPQAMFEVIRTLKNNELLDRKLAALEGREARAYHGVFSTHPDNDTRLQQIVKHAADTRGGGERRRDRFLDQIDGLVFGDNPAEGVFRGNRFIHPDLGFVFSFPQGWQGQNQSDQVVVAAPGGKAVVVLKLAPVDNVSDPASALSQLGMAQLARAESISPGGLPGITGLAQVNVGGTATPARITGILHGRHFYVFTGLAANAAALGTYDGVLREVGASFRPAGSEDLADVEARRIRVTRLKGAVSWDALASASPLSKLPEDQLRVLNAATGTTAEAGQRIKIIE